MARLYSGVDQQAEATHGTQRVVVFDLLLLLPATSWLPACEK